MKTYVLATFTLMLTAAWTFFFSQAKSHYERPDHLEARIELLNKKIKQEKLSHLFTQYEFEDFRQYVATLLPGIIKSKPKGEAAYPYRALASVVQKQKNDSLNYISGSKIFAEAKSYFLNKNYTSAIHGFNRLIGEHSYSAHVPESLYLKLESHYQLREFTQAIDTYEKLLDLYPSSELTGLSMVRIGKIYEFENRYDDAVAMYRNAIAAFPQREVSAVAKEQLHHSGL